MPADAEGYDGLSCSAPARSAWSADPLVPSLAAELRLTADFLSRGLPVVGVGLGAVILATAAGGGADEAPLRFEVGNARRVVPEALAGHLPEGFPYALYLRDRPALPAGAEVLAESASGEPLVFRSATGSSGSSGIRASSRRWSRTSSWNSTRPRTA